MEISVYRKDKEYKVLIDDGDYDKIKDLKLNIRFDNKYKPYVLVSNKTMLHRFIIDSKANQICIHKNNDKFDFRKENLFITTKKELVELVKTGKIKQRFDELNRIYYEF